MKKAALFFQILYISSSFLTAQPEPSLLTVSIKSGLEKEQNIIGLSLLKIEIVNTGDSAVLMHDPGHLFFKATWDGCPKPMNFSQRQLNNGPGIVTLKGHDTLKINANLNLFDLACNYYAETGKTWEGVAAMSVRAGIFCRTDRKYYYTDAFQIVVNPLGEKDLEAFAFIRERGYDPYQFTGMRQITVSGIDKTIAGPLIARYPESAFGDLASLSIAYLNATGLRMRPDLKARVLLLLEKPLASPHSFVRYLAEEWKKRYD